MARDWRKWHTEYDDPSSRLAERLRVVQGYVRDALDTMPPGPIRAISACAGEGRDLLGVLGDHPRRADVTGRLVELDPVLAATAVDHAPPGIEVVCADAAQASAYAGVVPADLVLACGIFGNISADDIRRTVEALPELCAAGATVVWTRHRRGPDLTVDIRQWFTTAGFEEVGFTTADDFLFGVGAHRLVGAPAAFAPDRRLFTFLVYDTPT
jgi:hypothetical protein